MSEAKPMKAYAVLEEYENTGGIFYARHAVVARRNGANEHADGEFSAVTCRRAHWADDYYGKGLPISVMVQHGWHFECAGCGRRIDEDMADWRGQTRDEHSFRQILSIARRYRKWEPSHIVGTQHGIAFCTSQCHDEHEAHEAERKRRQAHAIEVFRRRVLKRFPDAKLVDDPSRLRPHAFATMNKGRWCVEQVSVEFEFPGMKHGPAQYRWDRRDIWRDRRKPYFTCCAGDKEAFEEYAVATADNPLKG